MSTCAHHFYINYRLVSECSTSCVKAQSYFKKQPLHRCEVQEIRRLNYFFRNLLHSCFITKKALVLVKIKNKLRTKSGQLSRKHKNKVSRPAISKIMTEHQNRAWLSHILHCIQTSSNLTLSHFNITKLFNDYVTSYLFACYPLDS